MKCAIIQKFERSLALPFFGIGMKTVATAEFSKFAVILSAAFSQHHLLGFSSAGIPSPPALFVVMLPKTHLTSHSRMSGSRLSGSLRCFVYSSVYFLSPLLNFFCFC